MQRDQRARSGACSAGGSVAGGDQDHGDSGVAEGPGHGERRRACDGFHRPHKNQRLIFLLHMLGPETVAADPGLPLRLLPDVGSIPPMTSEQRRLLSLRVSFSGTPGRSVGTDPGADKDRWAAWRRPPEFGPAFPASEPVGHARLLLSYRHLRGELLFRAREIAEPPRLRPTVLLLDVSPPTFGPVGRSVFVGEGDAVQEQCGQSDAGPGGPAEFGQFATVGVHEGERGLSVF
ncbi:hypothetical protein QUF72_15710 [Desulfobacterales bacterium HSG2]|nr:hypothetical protein [Desulfobacterales bacterium HSG2]